MENNYNLTDEQLKLLSEDEFFAYLDAKAAYMKQYAVPLYHNKIKKYAYITKAVENQTGSSDKVFQDLDYSKLKTL
jgi:hypothetical protein